MRIRLDHIAEFYKKLVELVDTNGKFISFRNRHINSPSDFIPTAGTNDEANLFHETLIPNYTIYNGAELIRTLHEIRSKKLDISLIKEQDPGSKLDIVDVGSLYHQRKALLKLDQLANLKKETLIRQPVLYNNRAYSSDQISARIEFYLDVLKATRLGTEAAYRWCKEQHPLIILMQPEIILQKTILENPRTITYSRACRRQFSQRKNKP